MFLNQLIYHTRFQTSFEEKKSLTDSKLKTGFYFKLNRKTDLFAVVLAGVHFELNYKGNEMFGKMIIQFFLLIKLNSLSYYILQKI